jgi:pyruvate kinase
MKRIASLSERSSEFKRLVLNQINDMEQGKQRRKQTKTEAVGLATRELALAIQASYIACFTHSGSTARLIAKFRPSVPIIAFSPKLETVQRLALSWGVNPILIQDLTSVDELLAYAPHYLQEKGLVSSKDTVVVTAGVPVGSAGKTNMIKVVEME